MTAFIIEQIERYTNYIEDSNNYYANIKLVIESYHSANNMLYLLSHVDYDAFVKWNDLHGDRLERAYKKAIEAHTKWCISNCRDDLGKDNIIYSVVNSFFNLHITPDNNLLDHIGGFDQ